ncbi:CBS [Actinidia rufa]|uniref:CBS n=1 Tax=Actinidia rufa TaxID=165716 RepID=A0A7J0EFW7_9ERIC|nr:CBS [Actinidia rufa]
MRGGESGSDHQRRRLFEQKRVSRRQVCGIVKTVPVLPTDTVVMATKMVKNGLGFAVVTGDDLKSIMCKQQWIHPSLIFLHTWHNQKFLHPPVVDRDGIAVADVDVLHITHVAVATVSQVWYWGISICTTELTCWNSY